MSGVQDTGLTKVEEWIEQEKIEGSGSITGNYCIAEITGWMCLCDVSGLKNGDSTASTFWKCSENVFVAHFFMFQNVGDISKV